MTNTELTQEIYVQLLELYTRDLEIENNTLHLQLAFKQYQPTVPYIQPPRTYPSPNTGDPYGPPWYVTCRVE